MRRQLGSVLQLNPELLSKTNGLTSERDELKLELAKTKKKLQTQSEFIQSMKSCFQLICKLTNWDQIMSNHNNQN